MNYYITEFYKLYFIMLKLYEWRTFVKDILNFYENKI